MEGGSTSGPAPAYFNPTDYLAVPPYSPEARQCERVFLDAPESTRDFETPHMRIGLNEHVWGLAYGFKGSVEGSITFLGSRNDIEEVKVTLEGFITTTMSQRGLPVGHAAIPILSRSVTIYSKKSTDSSSFRWDGPHSFSLAIPTHCKIKGRSETLLPPSFAACLPRISSDVTYKVRVTMTRKGFRRRESKDIIISYLPKTRPLGPPMRSIPGSSRTPVPTDGTVKTVQLSSSWAHICQKYRSTPEQLDQSSTVYLSIPASEAFASGDLIPFAVNITCPESPALVKLFAPHMRLSLIKRTRIWSLGVEGEISVRDVLVQHGEVQYIDEGREGVVMVKGTVQAGRPGREGSWQLDGIVEVKYVIRISVHPPMTSNVAKHLPRFHHEETVKITTDEFGTHERELLTTGGIPPPALGVSRSSGP